MKPEKIKKILDKRLEEIKKMPKKELLELVKRMGLRFEGEKDE